MARGTRSSVVVGVAFLITFAIVANLAWAAAQKTTGPWYDARTSLVVYLTSLAVATILAVVLALSALSRISSLEALRARVDLNLATLEAASTPRVKDRPGGPGSDGFEAFQRSAVIDGLALAGTPSAGPPERAGHDALVGSTEVGLRPGSLPGASSFRQFVQERALLIDARKRVWSSVVGPLLACVVFAGIAGPMLPGSGAFAAVQFRLNTTLILFLSYGVGFLMVWAVLALHAAGTVPSGPDR